MHGWDLRRGAFTVVDSNLATVTPDLFGIWSTMPPTPAHVSFGPADTPEQPHPRWGADLPADLDLARAYLTNGETQLRAVDSTLVLAADCLERCIAATTTGSSFTAFPVAGSVSRPEALLWALLNNPRQAPVQFGVGDWAGKRWEQATTRFQSSIESLACGLTSFGWIETQVEGVIISRTAVTSTGDTNTVWQAPLTLERVALHQRTLALALASRTTLLRTIATAIRGALRIAAVSALPGGALLALPAVWTFIMRMLAE